MRWVAVNLRMYAWCSGTWCMLSDWVPGSRKKRCVLRCCSDQPSD